MIKERPSVLQADKVQYMKSSKMQEIYRLTMLGFSYRTCNISSREKVFFTLNELQNNLKNKQIVGEFLFLTTCSRIEIYFATKYPEKVIDSVLSMLHDLSNERIDNFYIKNDLDVVKHLYVVAAGLDSIAIGEEQILLQVRHASRLARTSGTSRSILSPLFDSAISVAVKLRKRYHIKGSSYAISLSSVGVKFLKNKLETKPQAILLVGNGTMARLAIKELEDVPIFVVTSNPRIKTPNRLVKYVSYQDIKEVINRCDVIISASKRSDYVIKFGDLVTGKKLLILDLGFPRNIDPRLKECSDIKLYNVDDLSGEYFPHDRFALIGMNQEIEKEAKNFYNWLYSTKLSPVLTELFSKANEIRLREVDIAKRRMGALSTKSSDIIDSLSTSIVNKLLYAVVKFARDPGLPLTLDQRLELISVLFNLKSGSSYERN